MDVAAQIAKLSQVSHFPELPGPELLPTRLTKAAAAVLPVAAAGLSIFTTTGHRVPLGASDDTAALAERLQFTTGEGPCLSAHATDVPAWATSEQMATRWPTFHAELLGHTPYRSIVSIPLGQPGLGGDAALDFYYTHPGRGPDAEQLEDLAEVTDMIAVLLTVSPHTTAATISGPAWLDSPPAQDRLRVWTAIGMINHALRLNSADALARLRGYAYSHDNTVDDIARALTDQAMPVEAFDA